MGTSYHISVNIATPQNGTQAQRKSPPHKTRCPCGAGGSGFFSASAIDDVLRRSGEEGADVFCRGVHDPLAALLRGPGDMRRDDAVFSLEKRIIPLDRLSRNNIKTSSINLTTVQSIRKILLNNQLTTAVVDKDNSILLPLFARTITSPG